MATTKLEPVLRPDGRWQCGFVTTCNRAVLQLNRNGADGGAAFLEASADGETFAPLTPPILAPDITVPVNLPKGFTVRVTSSSPITYAGVIADSAVAVVNPTQTYFPNAVSDYDGNWYDAVIVGNQVWTAENLRSSKYSDGTTIGAGWDLTINKPARILSYYNMLAAVKNESPSNNKIQGASPEGWHIPTATEMTTFIQYIKDRYEHSAKAIASKEGWDTSNPFQGSPSDNPSANNSSKFNASPAGYYTHAGYNVEKAGETREVAIMTSGYSQSGYSCLRLNYQTGIPLFTQMARNTLGNIRCVCDMEPGEFRSWYLRTYNTNNHQVDNKYATD